MGGKDKDGGNLDKSVLSGKVHVPSIKQKDLEDYRVAWPDLFIDGKVISQFPVRFNNYDGTEIETQYVIMGEYPTDPITRDENKKPVPERDPDVDKVYEYAGWDYGEGYTGFIPVLEPLTYTATYTSKVRCYNVKFVQPDSFVLANHIIKEIPDVPYGSYVNYSGATPTYTGLEEQAFTYYLFKGWDKSGYVTGHREIVAEYDECKYTAGYFNNKEIKDMRPVEIYALTRLVRQGQLSLSMNEDGSDYTGITGTKIDQSDVFSFNTGYDISYEDVSSELLVSSAMTFSGTVGNYYDTGLSLFDVDRSFVIAVDYEFASGNNKNATLMQCYDADMDGFRLYYDESPKVKWFDGAKNCASGTSREMLVIRHKAGEPGAHMYISNLSDTKPGTEVGYLDFSKVGTRIPNTDSTIVFGCNKSVTDDGTSYTNYAKGTIHWAKVWYGDLGEETCKKLAEYIHEEVKTHLCGFRRHYVSGTTSRPLLSFLGARALYTERCMNTSSGNVGGWASSDLNAWLNNRFYNGIPMQIKQLIKQVSVKSTAGSKSTELTSSDCYVYLPACADLSTSLPNQALSGELEDSSKTISYMTSKTDRIRTDYSETTAIKYYTRSPGLTFSSYFYRVETDGNFQETGNSTSTPLGIVISFEI